MRFLVKVCGHGLGDIAVSLPTCRAVARHGHRVELIIYDDSIMCQVIEGCDFLAAVHLKPKGLIAEIPFFYRLMKEKWDAILDLDQRERNPKVLKFIGNAKHNRTLLDMDKTLFSEGRVIFCSSILDGLTSDWHSNIEAKIPMKRERYESAFRIADIRGGGGRSVSNSCPWKIELSRLHKQMARKQLRRSH